MQTIMSVLDKSVNFVFDNMQESRYVQRPGADYFTAYLSSHNGCNKACRFCHLTATGQTSMVPATVQELEEQLLKVLYHNMVMHSELGWMPQFEQININFMARGEPLSSPVVQEWKQLEAALLEHCSASGLLPPRINISTIMPEEADLSNLNPELVTIYYSLYSMNPEFRKRWIPKAQNPYRALRELSLWQQRGGKVVIHHPFIAGENDCEHTVKTTIMAVKNAGLDTRFNLVRYNPPIGHYSSESPRVYENLSMWVEHYPDSKEVSRVGYDVNASCGMFFS